jgi:hypothetical protein
MRAGFTYPKRIAEVLKADVRYGDVRVLIDSFCVY